MNEENMDAQGRYPETPFNILKDINKKNKIDQGWNFTCDYLHNGYGPIKTAFILSQYLGESNGGTKE